MKTSMLLAATAAVSLASISASAEQYEGVLLFKSVASRAEVRAQAVAAAHSPDPYREGASAALSAQPTGEANRAVVRLQAIEAAHTDNPYSDAAGAGVLTLQGYGMDRSARAAARTASVPETR